MDPLSGGAGVLAFVVLALKGTNVIYKTVSGIREAPQNVQDLSSSVASLSTVLEQLKETKVVKESGTRHDLGTLKDVAKKCAEDVVRFETATKNIEVTSGDRRAVKYWKQVKTLFREKDLQTMRLCIIDHKNTLQVHLNMLVSDDSIRNDENTRLGIKQVLQNQTDHQSRNADLLAHHTSALTLVQKGIESVKDVQVTHASEHQVASEQITQKLTSIRSRVDKLPDISSQQSQAMQEMQEMLGMLAEILHRLPSKEREPLAAAPDLQDGSSSARYSSKADSHSRGMHVGEKSECPDGLDREDSDLFQCVSRLSRLARTESKRMVSDEAQSIIDDLERLLQIVSNQLMSSGTGGVREEKRRHRETCNTHGSSSSDILQQQLDLKKLRGLLISSGEVMVNQRARPEMPVSQLRVHAQSSTSDYEMPSVTMTVTTRKRWFKRVTEHEIPDDENKPAELVELSAMAVLMPKDSRLEAKMSAYFCQRKIQDGFFSILPTLWIHPIVPRDAEVFRRVEEGNLQDLVRLFQDGKASIRDCDPLGRSLLRYAIEHFSYDICQFLVENGSDVNSLEYDSDALERDPPISLLGISNSDSDSVNRFPRLLLDVGADVMIPYSTRFDGTVCPLSRLFKYGTTESIRMYLNSELSDFSTDVRLGNGRTVLLDYIYFRGRRDPQVIALFREKGADFHARDRDGNTCLHLYFQDRLSPSTSNDRHCFLTLIRSGADVSAKNNLGRTVAEAVEHTRNLFGGGQSRSYVADLWNTTLSHCGFDSADLRVSFRQDSQFSRLYTPFHYEALVRGDSWDVDDNIRWREQYRRQEEAKHDAALQLPDENSEYDSPSESTEDDRRSLLSRDGSEEAVEPKSTLQTHDEFPPCAPSSPLNSPSQSDIWDTIHEQHQEPDPWPSSQSRDSFVAVHVVEMDETDEDPGGFASPGPDAFMETEQPYDDQSPPLWEQTGEEVQASSTADGRNRTDEQS